MIPSLDTQEPSGTVFILSGTSSAGKSSILNALKEKEPSWVEMGPDLAGLHHMADMIRSHETLCYQYDKMTDSLDHSEIAHGAVVLFYNNPRGDGDLSFLRWKENVEPKKKKEIEDSLREMAKDPAFAKLDASMCADGTAAIIDGKMVEFILSHARMGHSLFVDGMAPPMMETFREKSKEGYHVQLGLAYLSLHHLTERVTRRNEVAQKSGDSMEIRSYQQITSQFIDHYRRATEQESPIGQISLTKVEKAFATIIARDEGKRDEWQELRSRLWKEYGWKEGEDKVGIVSRYPYDILIRTKNNASHSAETILRHGQSS